MSSSQSWIKLHGGKGRKIQLILVRLNLVFYLDLKIKLGVLFFLSYLRLGIDESFFCDVDQSRKGMGKEGAAMLT